MSAEPSKNFDYEELERALNALLKNMPESEERFREFAEPLSKPKRKRIRDSFDQFACRFRAAHLALDPIRQPADVFDPSDPQLVGHLIAETMLRQPKTGLQSAIGTPFYGSGIYAIYYRGNFDAYQPVSGTDTPLYVGKVDPEDPGAVTVQEQGQRLLARLKDHAKSISNVENLNVSDFDIRYLVVKSAWQNTAETFLIDNCKPIWNKEIGVCWGIGKHGDSVSTRANKRSRWDELHPGRKWAWKKGNTPNDLSPEKIKAAIARHYDKNPPN